MIEQLFAAVIVLCMALIVVVVALVVVILKRDEKPQRDTNLSDNPMNSTSQSAEPGISVIGSDLKGLRRRRDVRSRSTSGNLPSCDAASSEMSSHDTSHGPGNRNEVGQAPKPLPNAKDIRISSGNESLKLDCASGEASAERGLETSEVGKRLDRQKGEVEAGKSKISPGDGPESNSTHAFGQLSAAGQFESRVESPNSLLNDESAAKPAGSAPTDAGVRRARASGDYARMPTDMCVRSKP